MEKQPENQVLQKYDSCLSKFYKPVQVLWYILLEHNKPGIFQLYQRKNFSSICYSLLHRLAVCIQDNKATENFFEMKEFIYDNAEYMTESNPKLSMYYVTTGKWGNGDDRKNRLTSAGYNYNTIQSLVNQMLSGNTSNRKSDTEIAKEVIAGKWGNGADRKNRLTSAGYNYNNIQAIVNNLLR